MAAWCLYAEIGLDIAVGLELGANPSTANLHDLLKCFEECSMVADNILSKAYRTKLVAVHPDKNPGHVADANRKTDLLVNAWARLREPTLRSLYDQEMKLKLKVLSGHKRANPTYKYIHIHIHNRHFANRKLGAPHDYHIYVYTHTGLIAKADVSGIR